MPTILFQIIVFDDGTMQVITRDGSHVTKLGNVPSLTLDNTERKLQDDVPRKVLTPVPPMPHVEPESDHALESEVDDDIKMLSIRARHSIEKEKNKPISPIMSNEELGIIFGSINVPKKNKDDET